MPSPSRSNFTRPIAAQSSLSHCRTLRSSIRAHSTGHTSTMGRSQITMPPGVDAEVAGGVLDLGGEGQDVGGDVAAARAGPAGGR